MFFKLLFLAAFTSAANLPQAPFIRPCARDDPQFNACALKSAKEGIPIMAKGDKKLGIPALNPLHIPEVKVVEGSFTLHLQDLVLSGLENTVPEKTDFNFEKKNFSMEFTIPEFKILSRYSINGKILLLPIAGSGDLNTTMINGKLSMYHGFEIKKIDGIDHQKIVGLKAKFLPERMFISLTNLFNGDKALSENMNLFLNENWKDIYTDLAPTIETTFETILTSVLTSVNDIVPFDDVFPKTIAT